MRRRRYMTRDELADRLTQLVGDCITRGVAVTGMLDALEHLGVDINALVKIEVDEEPTTHPGPSHLGGF